MDESFIIKGCRNLRHLFCSTKTKTSSSVSIKQIRDCSWSTRNTAHQYSGHVVQDIVCLVYCLPWNRARKFRVSGPFFIFRGLHRQDLWSHWYKMLPSGQKLNRTQALKHHEQKMCGEKLPHWAFLRISVRAYPGEIGRDFDRWTLPDEILSVQVLSQFWAECTHKAT